MEMELLLTPHGPEENLTMEQAREDVETAFTLLRTTYGAYEYFGGDQVFDGLREDALARLEEADPGLPLADVVAEACIPCCPRWCGTGTLLLAADT